MLRTASDCHPFLYAASLFSMPSEDTLPQEEEATPTSGSPESESVPASSDESTGSSGVALAAMAALGLLGTGVAAGGYLFCWIRKSVELYGATAIPTTIGMLLISMGIGSWLVMRAVGNWERPLRRFATLQMVAGLFALAGPWWFPVVTGIYGSGYVSLSSNVWGLAVWRVVCISLAIGPTALLLGSAIPCYGRQFASRTRSAAPTLSFQLGICLLGAALGCALAGLRLIPVIGVNSTSVAFAVVHLLSATLVCVLPALAPKVSEEDWLDPREDVSDDGLSSDASPAPAEEGAADDVTSADDTETPAEAANDSTQPAGDTETESDDGAAAEPAAEEEEEESLLEGIDPAQAISWLTLVSGLLVIGYGLFVARILALIELSTADNWPIFVSAGLAAFGLAGLLQSLFRPSRERAAFQFFAGNAVAGLFVLSVVLLPVLTGWLGNFGQTYSPMRRWWLSAIGFGIPALCTGWAWASAYRVRMERVRDAGRDAGALVGSLLIGAGLGCGICPYLLLTYIGLSTGAKMLAGFAVLAGALGWLVVAPDAIRQLRGLLVVVAGGLLMLIPFFAEHTMRRSIPDDLISPDARVDLTMDGTTATLSVVRAEVDKYTLAMNQVWIGRSQPTHRTIIPALTGLFRSDPQSVLVVGLGDGQVVAGYLGAEENSERQVVCADLEAHVRSMVFNYFGGGAFINRPDFVWRHEDGAAYVRHSDQAFDVVAITAGGASFDPDKPGDLGPASWYSPRVANYYTKEFYADVARRLNTGGVVCQVVPLQLFDLAEFRSVVATFVATFPESSLWFNTEELLLVGGMAPLQIEPAALAAARESQALDYVYWGREANNLQKTPVLLGSFLTGPTGLKQIAEGQPLLTTDLPHLEWRLGVRGPERQAICKLLQDRRQDVNSILVEPLDQAGSALAGQARTRNLNHMVALTLVDGARAMAGAQQEDSAIALFDGALRLDPELIEAYHARAQLNWEQLDLNAARNDLLQAASIDPTNADTNFMLATLAREQKATQVAIQYLGRVLEHDGANLEAMVSLASTLATCRDDDLRDGARAVQLIDQAIDVLRQRGGVNAMIPAHIQLARADAYAADDNYPEAIKVADQLLQQAQAQGIQQMVDELTRRLDSYKSGRPYIP